jgi:hypothetical protein
MFVEMRDLLADLNVIKRKGVSFKSAKDVHGFQRAK